MKEGRHTHRTHWTQHWLMMDTMYLCIFYYYYYFAKSPVRSPVRSLVRNRTVDGVICISIVCCVHISFHHNFSSGRVVGGGWLFLPAYFLRIPSLNSSVTVSWRQYAYGNLWMFHIDYSCMLFALVACNSWCCFLSIFICFFSALPAFLLSAYFVFDPREVSANTWNRIVWSCVRSLDYILRINSKAVFN